MTTINTNNYLTSTQVAEVLELGRDTVKVYCNRKVFQNALKVGRDWMIPKKDVEEYRKRRKGPGRPPEDK